MGSYPLRPPKTAVQAYLAKTTAHARCLSDRTRSRTSVGLSRSTRLPAQAMSVQIVLCSVPRRAPFSNEPHSLSERHHERTLIAAAVLSTMAASSAYAGCTAGCDPAELFTATNVYTDIGEYGFITLRGKVDVSSSNGATVNNTQNVNVGGVDMKTPPQSYTSGNVTTGHPHERLLEQRERRWQRRRLQHSRTAPRVTHTNIHQQPYEPTTTAQRPALPQAAASRRAVAGALFRAIATRTRMPRQTALLTAGLIADIRGGRGVIVGGLAAGFAGALVHPRVGKRRRGLRSSSGRLRRDIRWLCSQQTQAPPPSPHYVLRGLQDPPTATRITATLIAGAHNYSDNAGSVTVNGSITQHINTQTATEMSAGIGSQCTDRHERQHRRQHRHRCGQRAVQRRGPVEHGCGPSLRQRADLLDPGIGRHGQDW